MSTPLAIPYDRKRAKTVLWFVADPEHAAVDSEAQRDLDENDAGRIFGADTIVTGIEVRP